MRLLSLWKGITGICAAGIYSLNCFLVVYPLYCLIADEQLSCVFVTFLQSSHSRTSFSSSVPFLGLKPFSSVSDVRAKRALAHGRVGTRFIASANRVYRPRCAKKSDIHALT